MAKILTHLSSLHKMDSQKSIFNGLSSFNFTLKDKIWDISSHWHAHGNNWVRHEIALCLPSLVLAQCAILDSHLYPTQPGYHGFAVLAYSHLILPPSGKWSFFVVVIFFGGMRFDVSISVSVCAIGIYCFALLHLAEGGLWDGPSLFIHDCSLSWDPAPLPPPGTPSFLTSLLSLSQHSRVTCWPS